MRIFLFSANFLSWCQKLPNQSVLDFDWRLQIWWHFGSGRGVPLLFRLAILIPGLAFCVLGSWCQGHGFDSPCGWNYFQLHLISKIICWNRVCSPQNIRIFHWSCSTLVDSVFVAVWFKLSQHSHFDIGTFPFFCQFIE